MTRVEESDVIESHAGGEVAGSRTSSPRALPRDLLALIGVDVLALTNTRFAELQLIVVDAEIRGFAVVLVSAAAHFASGDLLGDAEVGLPLTGIISHAVAEASVDINRSIGGVVGAVEGAGHRPRRKVVAVFDLNHILLTGGEVTENEIARTALRSGELDNAADTVADSVTTRRSALGPGRVFVRDDAVLGTRAAVELVGVPVATALSFTFITASSSAGSVEALTTTGTTVVITLSRVEAAVS